MPLCTSVTVTVAPAITPPLWSVTVPRIRPAVPCANEGRHRRNTPIVAASSLRDFPNRNESMPIPPLYGAIYLRWHSVPRDQRNYAMGFVTPQRIRQCTELYHHLRKCVNVNVNVNQLSQGRCRNPA